MSQHKFQSASIQDAYKKIESDLNSRKESLDNLSADIAEVEKILKETVCPLGFELEYKKEFECDVRDTTSPEDWDRINQRGYFGTLTEISFRLCWEKAPSGSPRLMHRVNSDMFRIYWKEGDPRDKFWRGKPELPFGSFGEPTAEPSTNSRPLIECDAFTRIQVAEYLPRFLSLLGEVLKNPCESTLKNSVFEVNDQWHEVWVKEAAKYHSFGEKNEAQEPAELAF